MATSAKLEELKLDDSGCVVDLNGAYPSELRVNSTSDGEIDACKRVCQGFKIDYQIIFCAAKTTTSRRRLDSTTTSTTVSVNASANGADSKSESTATSPTSSARASAQGSNSESSATVITSNVTEKTPSLVSFPPSPLPDEKSPSPLPKIRPSTALRRRLAPIIAGLIGGALLIIFLIGILILRGRWWGESEKNEDLEAYGIRQVPGTPVRFSYEDLRVATHDFRRITVKVDVYSFGIVLLEIVCARKNFDHSQPESESHLLRMLQEKAGEDRLIDIVKNLDDQYMPSDREEIIRMIKIAAWCLQDDPERRPLMSTVVKVLEGVMEVDSNIVYEFHHALIAPAAADHQNSSAQPQASELSTAR
ncbi:G-TYPE LECTIN S-RECEPTOR-LIKE SERINE/THREONINE-PROTEIN KINASE SD2-5 [Salix koriyanagi]|nr:G-TYPE LECTIN S-RECEPTOR-LIKE SERINE/THREONINE-PROTEIN KINASE SD2-5 [Salix koriyanagi]